MAKTVIFLGRANTGLTLAGMTVDLCKKISDGSAVSQTGMAMREEGVGIYVLDNFNVTEDTTISLYKAGDTTISGVGIFSPADGDIALETTAQAIKAKTDTISWADILRIKGLVFEDHYEHTVVRDANGNKTSSVIDIYDSAVNAETHDGVTGLIESYTATATYINNKMTSFLSKRVP